MRSAVKNLKRANSERAGYEVRWKLQGGGMVVTDGSAKYWLRIMLQDEVTKNVFREMDGLLVSMSVLSSIQDHHHTQDDHGRYEYYATRLRRIGRSDD